MAHAIFGNMFYGTRTAAWHKIGTILPEPALPSEALRLIDADYPIVKTPLLTAVPYEMGASTIVPISGKYALTRLPAGGDAEPAFFGIVGDGYEVLQNADIAGFLDPLAEKWPLETLGVLSEGKGLFFTLSLGEWDIAGEQMKEYLLAHNATDGKTGMTIGYTPIRVVCQNTLTTGLRKASVKATLTHKRGIKDDVAMRLSLMKDLQSAQLSGREAFKSLAALVLKTKEITKVVERIYRLPNVPDRVAAAEKHNGHGVSEGFRVLLEEAKAAHEWQVKAQKDNREAMHVLIEKHNDEFPQTANTAWAVYNAVVEIEDFGGRQAVGTPFSAVFGSRADKKREAFAILSSGVK